MLLEYSLNHSIEAPGIRPSPNPGLRAWFPGARGAVRLTPPWRGCWRSGLPGPRACPLVLDDHAALHHEAEPLELGQVCERVAVGRDQVGVAAGGDGPGAVAPAEEVGGAGRRHGEDLDGGGAGLLQRAELPGVLAVRVDAGVGAESELDAGLHGAPPVGELRLAELDLLVHHLRRQAEVVGL